MIPTQSTILLILSRLLEYPDSHFLNERSMIEEVANDHLSSVDIQRDILERLQPLYEMELNKLQELYVETFDYRDKTGLYLTAHELGDSRKRGAALIKLQKMIDQAGYVYEGKELSDYIPMLLELLAVAPKNEEFIRLKSRLSAAIHRIQNNVPTQNPYYDVIGILTKFIFEAPKAEDMMQLENERELADLEPLPYPIMYQ